MAMSTGLQEEDSVVVPMVANLAFSWQEIAHLLPENKKNIVLKCMPNSYKYKWDTIFCNILCNVSHLFDNFFNLPSSNLIFQGFNVALLQIRSNITATHQKDTL